MMNLHEHIRPRLLVEVHFEDSSLLTVHIEKCVRCSECPEQYNRVTDMGVFSATVLLKID